MSHHFPRALSIAFAAFFCAKIVAAGDLPLNTLSDAEKAAGWKLLFDGKTTQGWHGFKSKEVPATWSAKDGALVLTPGKASKLSLVTDGEFSDFELSIDWKLQPGGNSGIFYRMAEEGNEPNWTGIEYQILDNAANARLSPESMTASAYLVYAPSKDVTKPLGEWNQTRLIVRGNHVEHYLNGEKVVEYELGSEDWQARMMKTKFKTHPQYGRMPKGHLCLQDHGGAVEFRNIKIKE